MLPPPGLAGEMPHGRPVSQFLGSDCNVEDTPVADVVEPLHDTHVGEEVPLLHFFHEFSQLSHLSLETVQFSQLMVHGAAGLDFPLGGELRVRGEKAEG